MSRLRKLAIKNKGNDAFFKKIGELISNKNTLADVLKAITIAFRDYKMLVEPSGIDLESPTSFEEEKLLLNEFMDSNTIIECLEKLTNEKLIQDDVDPRLDRILDYLKMEFLALLQYYS